MSSWRDHEFVTRLFRRDPTLGEQLHHTARGSPTPYYTDAAFDAADWDEFDPTYRYANAVAIFRTTQSRTFAVSLEVVRYHDSEKRWTWPMLFAMLCEQLEGTPIGILALCPDQEVTDWAGTPIDTTGGWGGKEGRGGLVVFPTAVGPCDVPLVTDPAAGRADPELTILATVLHRNPPGTENALAAALSQLDDDSAAFFADYVREISGPARVS